MNGQQLAARFCLVQIIVPSPSAEEARSSIALLCFLRETLPGSGQEVMLDSCPEAILSTPRYQSKRSHIWTLHHHNVL